MVWVKHRCHHFTLLVKPWFFVIYGFSFLFVQVWFILESIPYQSRGKALALPLGPPSGFTMGGSHPPTCQVSLQLPYGFVFEEDVDC